MCTHVQALCVLGNLKLTDGMTLYHCKVQSIQLALLNRMKSGTLPQLAITEELLDCVAREGVESMAREGGFVGCLEGKA